MGSQPLRVDAGDTACGKPGGLRLGLEPDRVGLPAVGRQCRHGRGIGEFEVEAAREFAGEAADGEAVSAVGGDVQFDDGVAETEQLALGREVDGPSRVLPEELVIADAVEVGHEVLVDGEAIAGELDVRGEDVGPREGAVLAVKVLEALCLTGDATAVC